MHEMQSIVTDVCGVCQSVHQSVSLFVTRLNSVAHAVCVAHLLQPLPDYFDLLFYLL